MKKAASPSLNADEKSTGPKAPISPCHIRSVEIGAIGPALKPCAFGTIVGRAALPSITSDLFRLAGHRGAPRRSGEPI
jgi:hypothetical protein